MKTDRELLELAAKAAGIEYNTNYGKGLWVGEFYSGKNWNPLDDDGDNRRLQVALKLGLVPVDDGGWACITWDHDDEVTLAFDLDPNLAIVKAAAIIGENMK